MPKPEIRDAFRRISVYDEYEADPLLEDLLNLPHSSAAQLAHACEPLDRSRAAKRSIRRYPFAGLQVGQSFIVPCPSAPKLTSMRVLCARWGSKLDRKFRCVRLPTGGLRVRRIS